MWGVRERGERDTNPARGETVNAQSPPPVLSCSVPMENGTHHGVVVGWLAGYLVMEHNINISGSNGMMMGWGVGLLVLLLLCFSSYCGNSGSW